jgi:hypothetical protein
MSLRNSLDVRSIRWLAVAGVGAFGGSLGLLIVLKALPYSTVILEPVALSQARQRPSPNFSIGSVSWSVAAFAETKALQPFRDTMHAACGDAKGLAAAACATRQLEVSSFGNPTSEFVNVDFDPIAHLERHLKGAPGHCLTRSAILAAELLATGTPARVVQMMPARGKGHTLVEVWDEALGWTVVDPTAGGYITGVTEHASAADLLADPNRVDWRSFKAQATPAEVVAKREYFRTLLAGNLLYPEPWLYLRVGQRIAPWPWRGLYARIGPSHATLGPMQRTLSWAIPALATVGLALLATAWRRHSSAAAVRTIPLATEARPTGADVNRRPGILDPDY